MSYWLAMMELPAGALGLTGAVSFSFVSSLRHRLLRCLKVQQLSRRRRQWACLLRTLLPNHPIRTHDQRCHLP